MGVFKWVGNHKKQCIYLAVVSILLLIGVLLVMQKGFYMEDMFEKTFYALKSETDTERVFHGKDTDIVQKGFFPNDEQVLITVTKADTEPIQWILTMNGTNENGFKLLIATDGNNTYEGSYSGNGNSFRFDDWEKYIAWDTVYTSDWSGSAANLVNRYESEDYIGSLLRMAYGDTDKNNQFGGLLFLYVVLVGCAYLSLFYAQAIFDWNKQWEFSFRNREELEPSDWYFVQHKIVAVVYLALALWLWFVATGIWKMS